MVIPSPILTTKQYFFVQIQHWYFGFQFVVPWKFVLQIFFLKWVFEMWCCMQESDSYRPQRSFYSCLSFCSQGGSSASVHAGIPPRRPGTHPLGADPPRPDTPLAADTPREQTPPSPDGYCCGRYASYWNAFSLHIFLIFVTDGSITRRWIPEQDAFLAAHRLWEIWRSHRHKGCWGISVMAYFHWRTRIRTRTRIPVLCRIFPLVQIQTLIPWLKCM